jgi:sulfotransferase
MHAVRHKVEYRKRESCIPPDIFAKYAEVKFWLRPELNRQGMKII